MKKRISRIFIGIAVILIGIALVGNLLGLWEIKDIFDGWWAVIIVAASLSSIISDRANLINIYFLIFGSVAFLCERNVLKTDVSIWLLALYLLIVVFGCKLVVSAFFRREKVSTDTKKGDVSFEDKRLDFSGLEFDGGSYDVSFGSLTIDLKNATVADGAKMNIDVSFGSATIIVPEGVTVSVKENASFGSVKNKTGSGDGKRLELCADVSFGSVEISR